MVELRLWLLEQQLDGGLVLSPSAFGLGLVLVGFSIWSLRRLVAAPRRETAPAVMLAGPVRRGPSAIEVLIAVISLITALARLGWH